MKGIWVINLSKWKPVLFICVAALFVASWLVIQRDYVPVFSTPDGPQAFYKAEDSDQKVALTFNISWGEHNVSPILEVLQQNDVEHATFFLLASWAETYPDLVEEIADAGYTIGSHGYQYKNYTSLDEAQVVQDMRRSKQVLEELTGETPTLLRPPNGAFSPKTLELADQQNMDVIHWSINSYDYENPGTEAIVKNSLEQTGAGDVLLFHASDSVKQTAAALPKILKGLKQDGYDFATIEELMSHTDAENEEVK
ncbi:polysaccharide deacetylase family sporulation protein PdaB [Bacillus sp. Marseille-P3800]|uniref:polysaccharide deacetylase family sporulation protein PdaB n=1 Tax=Bacillus sp. Marseille-P3800 TaxID=2014782 RepID=UPI000C08AD7F|nr:polysaccharide deacetylase family sporulation protein PdaB [Bacillus sp. Marseille-P3800]